MGFPCVVTNELNAYLDQCDELERKEEAFEEFVEECIDDMMYYGKVTFNQRSCNSIVHTMQEANCEYIQSEKDDDYSDFENLACAMLIAKNKDEAELNFSDHMKEVVTWYFTKHMKDEVRAEFEKRVEADREDAELARHGL